MIHEIVGEIVRFGGVHAATRPGVSSGDYSWHEMRSIRQTYLDELLNVSEHGLVALHLTLADRPFNERYFSSLFRELKRRDCILNGDNYIPFYFVYPLLAWAARDGLFKGKKILVVHGATGEKEAKIRATLRDEYGAREVDWIHLSPDRAWFDSFQLTRRQIQVSEICLVGAGLAKPRIFSSLQQVQGPVIDGGYMFEVWFDPNLATRRTFCAPPTQFWHQS